MTYTVKGLPRDRFAGLFGRSDAELAARGARRVFADADFGFPCRVSLEDAAAGEPLILLNYVSHDVVGPYRATHAILVREQAEVAPPLVDATPPVFAWRTVSLRAFDAGPAGLARRRAGGARPRDPRAAGRPADRPHRRTQRRARLFFGPDRTL